MRTKTVPQGTLNLPNPYLQDNSYEPNGRWITGPITKRKLRFCNEFGLSLILGTEK